MKNKTSRALALVFAIIIAITAASAVVTYFALTRHFDHAICHYDLSPVSYAARILPWCAVATAIVCAFAVRRRTSLEGEPSVSTFGTFASLLSGLLMLSSAVFVVIGERTIESRFPQIVWVAAAAAVLGGIYFVASPFVKDGAVITALSFAPALWAASVLLQEYFRAGEPINSPLRDLDLSMYAFLLLYFTESIRFRLKSQSSAIYYFCALSAIAFTGCAALSKLAVSFTDSSFDFNLISYCVGTALVLHIASDIVSVIRMTDAHDIAPKHAAKRGS